MIPSEEQHQVEILRNQKAWAAKPLLREVYSGFYRRILASMDSSLPGRIVEVGSGIGILKTHLPDAVCSDLFPNPWLDLVCDAYALPFAEGSVSHLILFDVFHHLQKPKRLMNEAHRVLTASGRLILFEPYMSWTSYPAYRCFHHEPIGWSEAIDLDDTAPRGRGYYAAQGNATRLFFRQRVSEWAGAWGLLRAEAFSSFSYLLTGGFSQRCYYSAGLLPTLRRMDALLSRWPKLFGARCLVCLARE